MTQNLEQEDGYVVQCVWCGAKIREDDEEESTGVCLKCFYQMLTNHLQSQKRTSYGEFVSDR
jgi:DNA-directed RNA polymerase subunit RPC12/RpoP